MEQEFNPKHKSLGQNLIDGLNDIIEKENLSPKTPREQFEEKFGKIGELWGIKVGDKFLTGIRTNTEIHSIKEQQELFICDVYNEKEKIFYIHHTVAFKDFINPGHVTKRLVRVSPAIGITKNGPTVLSPHVVESRHAASTWFNLNGLYVDEIQWPLRDQSGQPVWYLREEEVE